MQKEVKITMERVLGAATIFKQGGSLRLILPKKTLAMLKIQKNNEDSDFNTVILLATSKGILIRSLEDYLKDEDMKT